jgi:hypothetical protein
VISGPRGGARGETKPTEEDDADRLVAEVDRQVGGSTSQTSTASVVPNDNYAGGSFTVNGSTSAALLDNHTNGKISCSGNSTVVGGGNTAKGGALGQCAGL